MRTYSLIAALLLVLAGVAGAGNLTVPGDLTVNDDVHVQGTGTFGSWVSISGTMTCTDYSCPSILQRYTETWYEGTTEGKAWPDTIVRSGDVPLFVLPSAGDVKDVIAYLHTSGAGYDSLIVDVKLEGATIFGAAEDRLRFLPTAANAGNTKAGGTGIREAVLDPLKVTGSAGELVAVNCRVYGSAGTHPTGLFVIMIFEPDYP